MPIPPLELRKLVGPEDPAAFDNPSGTPIYADFGIPPETYETVFDFGCGCGRLARQLLQQNPKPRRYIGIDVHKGMIKWCRNSITPVDPNYQFFHQDVYSPSYAPGNSLRLAEPLPVNDGEFSLVIACSVFTHLTMSQTEYYLSEVARILTPHGLAFTSWFFFDRASFPFLPEVYCLYTSESDSSQAVLFDREWFITTVRNLGLGVRITRPPGIAGHQWVVFLAKRTPDMVDQFPLGEDGAEWVSGASKKPIAETTLPPEKIPKTSTPRVGPYKPTLPPFIQLLPGLGGKRLFFWSIGRLLTSPIRTVRRWF
jgi:ubiquinone/menaquinone biosynthesis C-methylase UbiE